MRSLQILIVLIALLNLITSDRSFLQIDRDIFSSGKKFDIKVSSPKYIVSPTVDLPSQINIQASNNCLAWIKTSSNVLYIAWRSAPYHFASSKTQIFLMSSLDDGKTWNYQTQIYRGTDMRQPYFLQINNSLFFYFFQAGTNPIAFQPHSMLRMQYQGQQGKWSQAESWGQIGQIAWQYNIHDGQAYAVSYCGSHYSIEEKENIRLYLNKTSDGINWDPVGSNNGKQFVYEGGISQVGWQFDIDGNIWAVGRNQDGDESGWGRRVAQAEVNDIMNWKFTDSLSNPDIIESPRMFRHGNDLYLVGRTDPDGDFEQHNFIEDHMGNSLHHLIDLGMYSLRRHGTAIWKVQADGQLVKIADIPGCGDNAFPSILRIDQHKYWIASYSSPFDKCKEWSWIHGQISGDGTQIYYVEVQFIQSKYV